MTQVFISYSHKDREFVSQLADDLECEANRWRYGLDTSQEEWFPAEHHLADKGGSEIIPKLLLNCRLWQQKDDAMWGFEDSCKWKPKPRKA